MTNQPKSPSHVLKLTLLQNSHSFLTEALAKAVAAESNPNQWKFAIFNLIQAIELSVKERLRREHPLLIYQNVDKPKYTVNLKEALPRLCGGCKLVLGQADVDMINRAAEWRNQILHSEFSISTTDLKPTFAKLLGFITHFHREFLNERLEHVIEDVLWEQAVGIKDYGEALFARAKHKFAQEKIDPAHIWACLSCGYNAFVIQKQTGRCHVCGYRDHVVTCDGCGNFQYASQMSSVTTPDTGCEMLCPDCVKADPDFWYAFARKQPE